MQTNHQISLVYDLLPDIEISLSLVQVIASNKAQ